MPERTYTTRHGTKATIKTGNIGKRRRMPGWGLARLTRNALKRGRNVAEGGLMPEGLTQIEHADRWPGCYVGQHRGYAGDGARFVFGECPSRSFRGIIGNIDIPLVCPAFILIPANGEEFLV